MFMLNSRRRAPTAYSLELLLFRLGGSCILLFLLASNMHVPWRHVLGFLAVHHSVAVVRHAAVTAIIMSLMQAAHG